jgi:hypothetical protein
MRRVWAADPGIRDFVGPADYAWDYNAPDGVPGFALELGHGDLKKLLAQAIGEPEDPPEERAEEPAGDEPPAPAVAEAIAEAEPGPLPEDAPLRLSAIESSPLPPSPEAPCEETMEQERDIAPPPRRHGGAVPRMG